MVRITEVEPRSRADKCGIRAGDILLRVNSREINDVLDYRFFIADKSIVLELERDGKIFTAKIKKAEYDDIGLGFETPLMDEKHSCTNRCVFCFIDQLPGGMRESLYFKDDDSRLSFLHGNYITMTNLSKADIDRIIEMHISPVNISVHTTNPELRVKMMRNKHAGRVLSYIDKLAAAGNAICAQIVLCKGLNDGKELERSMNDLVKYYPALRSVAIVPVGLTKYREKLYELELFNAEESAAVIDAVECMAEKCLEKFGTRLFYCSDEFYLTAGRELPSDEYYEDYSQIENGVGMLTSLESEVLRELDFSEDYAEKFKAPRKVSIVTGVSAYATVRALSDKLEAAFSGFEADVIAIKNNFFGETITVSGLLTGADIYDQLKDRELFDELIIPANTLRAEGDLFLCGMTPDELSEKLGVKIRFSGDSGMDFVNALLGTDICV
jgi:putative radical SAM enzyme (TIGR03279 family)